MERGILGPTKRHPDKCKVSTGNKAEIHRRRETQSHRAQDKRIPVPKRAGCRQTQSDGSVRAPGMRQKRRTEASGRGRRAPRVSPHTLLRPGSRAAARGCVAGSRLWKGGEGSPRSRNLSPLRGPRLRAPSLLLAVTQLRLPLGRKPLGIRRAQLGRLRSGRLRLPLELQLRFGLGGPGRCLG